MGTQFEEIYNLNKTIKSDSRLLNKPSNIIYRQFYNALVFSVSEFLADCYKDLSDRLDFEEKEYEFDATMGTNTFSLDAPPTEFTDIYVSIDDDSYNYRYELNESTNIITITPALAVNCNVYISVFRKGYFNQILNDVEKVILAEGINVVMLEEMRNKDTLLNQLVYNKDANIASQANHIKSLNDSIKDQYDLIVRPKIRKYTYDFSPNKLSGMSGKQGYSSSGGGYVW